MLIRTRPSLGMYPRLSDEQLPEGAAVLARNCRLSGRNMTPWRQLGASVQSVPAGTQAIRKYNSLWFYWPEDTDVARSPLISDAFDRVYFTRQGLGAYFTYAAIATAGQTTAHKLGIPAPTVAPVLSWEYAGTFVFAALGATEQEAGDDAGQMSDWQIAGLTDAHMESDYLYWTMSDSGGTRTVALYTSTDTADKIAEGSLAGDGTVTLAAVGGSGVTGSVDVAYTADELDIANNYLSFDWETRDYIYTWQDVVGAEGPNSEVAEITLPVGADVTVTLPGAAPTVDGYTYTNIDTAKIYRVNTGSTDSEYQLVVSTAVTTASYADTVLDEDLGGTLPSAAWDPPPPDLHGLVAHPSGFLAGYSPSLKAICLSEPFYPHAWPVANRVPLIDDPVGLGIFGMSVAAMTQGPPVLITGQSPGAVSVERYEAGWACVAKRSIVDLGEAVIYAAKEGLVLFGAGRSELITREHVTADEWDDYGPEALSAFGWDGNYLGFNGSKGLIFPRTGQLSELSDVATAGWRDPSDGTLYLAVGTQIVPWQGGASRMSALFTDRVTRAPRPVNLGFAQVIARGYPLTFRLYADGALKHTQTVASRDPFSLPGGYLADRWQPEVEGAETVDEVLVGATMNDLRGA